jgi:hypothetical protein
VSRFVVESDLERELAADADHLRGLAWGEAASVTPRGVWGYTARRSSRASVATRGCASSAPGRRMKARS